MPISGFGGGVALFNYPAGKLMGGLAGLFGEVQPNQTISN